jgi:hypothetical protein|tara:strand:+ start:4374 stop:4940 length:567 start_codon:yes stop_codon:yes gene_type:complete
MSNPFHKNLETLLDKMGKQVMNRSKAALQSAKPYSKGGGDLENSVNYKVVKTDEGYEVQFTMTYYGKFVDKGVSGYQIKRSFTNYQGQNVTAPGNGFRKGTKVIPIDPLVKWIKRRGLKGRDEKSGRYISHVSLAFIIGRKIKREGIQGISFFQSPLGLAMKTFKDEVKRAVAQDIEDTLKGINFKFD